MLNTQRDNACIYIGARALPDLASVRMMMTTNYTNWTRSSSMQFSGSAPNLLPVVQAKQPKTRSSGCVGLFQGTSCEPEHLKTY